MTTVGFKLNRFSWENCPSDRSTDGFEFCKNSQISWRIPVAAVSIHMAHPLEDLRVGYNVKTKDPQLVLQESTFADNPCPIVRRRVYWGLEINLIGVGRTSSVLVNNVF